MLRRGDSPSGFQRVPAPSIRRTPASLRRRVLGPTTSWQGSWRRGAPLRQPPARRWPRVRQHVSVCLSCRMTFPTIFSLGAACGGGKQRRDRFEGALRAECGPQHLSGTRAGQLQSVHQQYSVTTCSMLVIGHPRQVQPDLVQRRSRLSPAMPMGVSVHNRLWGPLCGVPGRAGGSCPAPGGTGRTATSRAHRGAAGRAGGAGHGMGVGGPVPPFQKTGMAVPHPYDSRGAAVTVCAPTAVRVRSLAPG